jgi:hypothetical protein
MSLVILRYALHNNTSSHNYFTVNTTEAGLAAPRARLRAEGSEPPTHAVTGPLGATDWPWAFTKASISGVSVNLTTLLAPGAGQKAAFARRPWRGA